MVLLVTALLNLVILLHGHLKLCFLVFLVDRSLKRRQVKPLAASLLDALDYDSSDDSDFEVGDASGKHSHYDVQQCFCKR